MKTKKEGVFNFLYESTIFKIVTRKHRAQQLNAI